MFDLDTQLAKLAEAHQNANDPSEPYSGVTLLFNGDWRVGCPKDSNNIRADWDVVSPFELVYTGLTVKEVLAADEQIKKNEEET